MKGNYVLAVCALFVACVFAYGQSRIAYADQLQVVFLNVGQGNATYIRTPSGTELLIDTGANLAGLRELSNYRPWWDRHLDYLILTHPDMDHIGAAANVLQRFEIGAVVTNNKRNDNGVDAAVLQELVDGTETVHIVQAGDRIETNDQVELQVL